MSCPDSNAPIDININDIAGKCDLKCSYSFKYPSSSCVVTNRGDYISIAYDNPSTAPVKYTDIAYFVSEVRVYSPSLHSYRGAKVDGEMIIVHNSSSGSSPLLVCVPIVKSGNDSSASTIMTEIIQTMSTNAPTNGEQTNVNINDFNLNGFVPKKTFFTYTANEPYQPCATTVDYVVFIPSSGPINITETTLSLLQTIITPNQYDIKTGPQLFYNEKGTGVAGSSSGSEDIYIDCKPVGMSDDEINIVTGAVVPLPDIMTYLNSMINSPYFITIFGTSLVIFLLYMVNSLFGKKKPVDTVTVAAVSTVKEIVKKGGSKFL